jgi:hypothetical protein
MELTKVCTWCGVTKPRETFRARSYDKRYVHATCMDCEIVKSKDYRYRVRRKVIDYYGGKCQCCGITTLQFLALDHIDGGGRKHQLEVGVGFRFYLWVQKHLPKNLRVLCHNCNMGRFLNGGTCPHQLGVLQSN